MHLTRDAAWNLLQEYTKGESLLKHALANFLLSVKQERASKPCA